MNSEPHNQNRDTHIEELDGQLRQAVERVRDTGVPEDSMRDVLGRLQQQGAPVIRSRKPIGSRVAWTIALTATAAIGIVMVLQQLYTDDPKPSEIARDRRPSPTVTTEESLEPREAVAEPEQPPTFWTYHQASRRSAEDLDLLLDAHSQQVAFVESTALML
jgi:hypothetical protein